MEIRYIVHFDNKDLSESITGNRLRFDEQPDTFDLAKTHRIDVLVDQPETLNSNDFTDSPIKRVTIESEERTGDEVIYDFIEKCCFLREDLVESGYSIQQLFEIDQKIIDLRTELIRLMDKL